tara:strand:- start:13276 stop:13920 length:645 start_codon:yes stop_codon:yes gene_type:complete
MKKQIENMILSVKSYLRLFKKIGVNERKILRAMLKTDRKGFVDINFKKHAYIDEALPISGGQTISQPSTVARMLQLLELKEGDKVLEVGTGSSWNAALIGFLVSNNGKVLSLEIVNGLFQTAKNRIEKSKIKNVIVIKKDFRDLDESFDKIIFTAGIVYKQEKLIENFARKRLNNNGILLCPHRSGPLIIFKKDREKINKLYTSDNYVFVPLVL